MCGIIGIFGKESLEQSDYQAVRSGMDAMALRGPDAAGVHDGAGFCFGHRRLSILDPGSGKQPWVDSASGVVLTYNGEIYNFREIKERLRSRGHSFVSSCDTEVLAKAYVEWGKECLQYLNGIFAFGVYDPRDDALWLVRDRLGVKPLYYHCSSGRLRFGSTLKALFAFPEVDRVLDPAAVWHYLRTIRTSFGKRTLLRNIYSLRPGEELWWKRSSAPATRTYWQLPAIAETDKSAISFEAAVEETRAKVDAAVGAQLISDVPLGGFLSGGLDSSVLTSAALAGGASRFGTYSVGYKEKGFNEWEYIREAAEYYEVPNHEIHLEAGNYLADWEWLSGEKGLPLSTPNEVPIWHLAKSFRSRFCVALSGEGADEVFGGYVGPTFCSIDYDRSQGRLGPVSQAALYRLYGTDKFLSRLDHYFRINSWMSVERLQEILNEDWYPDEREESVSAYYGELFQAAESCTTLDAYMRVHLSVNLEGLLNRLDTSTMAASVEGRVPFTDHRLVEWINQLPDAYKMSLLANNRWAELQEKNSFELIQDQRVESKRLLRSAFQNRVCSSILAREKMSFPVPFSQWFSTFLLEPFRDWMNDAPIIRSLLSDESRLALANSDAPDPMVAWPLMNLAIWQRQFHIHG
ncbi:MAG: asparagine synthase (glutamine-hydrolyzing) [Verrucomicrobiae bacterium]|nr:asparagine synthase (glutamine-hydrolyzing) [Verrucomicrobiae bacterium]